MLLEHVSAPRSAGVWDLQPLGLLRAMLKVGSSALCGSQLQAKAPEQQQQEEEQGLHHGSGQGWALRAAAAASQGFHRLSRNLAPGYLAAVLAEEHEDREMQTHRNPSL